MRCSLPHWLHLRLGHPLIWGMGLLFVFNLCPHGRSISQVSSFLPSLGVGASCLPTVLHVGIATADMCVRGRLVPSSIYAFVMLSLVTCLTLSIATSTFKACWSSIISLNPTFGTVVSMPILINGGFLSSGGAHMPRSLGSMSCGSLFFIAFMKVLTNTPSGTCLNAVYPMGCTLVLAVISK